MSHTMGISELSNLKSREHSSVFELVQDVEALIS